MASFSNFNLILTVDHHIAVWPQCPLMNGLDLHTIELLSRMDFFSADWNAECHKSREVGAFFKKLFFIFDLFLQLLNSSQVWVQRLLLNRLGISLVGTLWLIIEAIYVFGVQLVLRWTRIIFRLGLKFGRGCLDFNFWAKFCSQLFSTSYWQ